MSFGMNIHYANPNEVSGLLDWTGVRWYYVNEPREHEVGQMMVGDAIVALRGQSVGAGPSGHTLTCPGSCSQTIFDGPVTIFAEGLHLHETGVRLVNQVFRNGELVNRAAVDYFDFRQNGINPTRQQPYQVLPGDSFQTTCYYDNVDNSTTFGFGTREEMCQSLLMYYPANHQMKGYCSPDGKAGNCSATYEQFDTDDSFDRTFGVPLPTCPEDADSSTTSTSASHAVAMVASSGWAAALASSLLVLATMVAM